MTVPWVPVVVEFGKPRQVWCDGCQTSARTDVELHGFTDDGIALIGVWSCCDYCDPDGGPTNG